MVVESANVVVNDRKQRPVPARSGAQRLVQILHKPLSMTNVLTGMVRPATWWRHKREVRQRATSCRCEEVAIVMEMVLVSCNAIHNQVIENARRIGVERE